jgi:DNA-directed RNA polymerase specialized sigma24 family protein
MPGAMSSEGDRLRNPEDLKRLLSRLDPDSLRAWEKYEELRRRLVKFFAWNRCLDPEDLADEVLDRVAAKPDSEEIREVEKYALGVARFVHLEARRESKRLICSDDLPGGEDAFADGHDPAEEMVDMIFQEIRLDCLRQCLARLMPHDRELVILYYSAEQEKQKIVRRSLAEKSGLTLGALRVRTSRLREQLEQCVLFFLESRRQTSDLAS